MEGRATLSPTIRWTGGSTDQTSHSTGADDGIIVGDESKDAVFGNTISNTFDCGIEFLGDIGYSSFNNNTFTNTALCGIGGWYYISFHNNVVHGNAVSGAANLFTFMRYYGLRPANWNGHGAAADTGVYLTQNTFDGNSITNWYSTSYFQPANGYSVYIPFDQSGDYLAFDNTLNHSNETFPTPSQFHLTGNSFSNNNFGPAAAFFGEPAYPGAVTDQGNNVCVQQSLSDYPLACGRQACGSQANPWNGQTILLTSATHMGQWAQRIANGTCEMGTYSRPITRSGVTNYSWVQQSGVACSVPAGTWCPAPT
jgi:hypothetical protein